MRLGAPQGPIRGHQNVIVLHGYLKFKELTEVIDKIANSASDSKQYLHGNEMHEKKITQSEALRILDNIYNGEWNATTEKCLLVANQIGMNLKP